MRWTLRRGVASPVDKVPWDEIKRELLEKGFLEEVAGCVGGYV
jgi:hypothetical protein